jgi:hypothetical protein
MFVFHIQITRPEGWLIDVHADRMAFSIVSDHHNAGGYRSHSNPSDVHGIGKAFFPEHVMLSLSESMVHPAAEGLTDSHVGPRYLAGAVRNFSLSIFLSVD